MCSFPPARHILELCNAAVKKGDDSRSRSIVAIVSPDGNLVLLRNSPSRSASGNHLPFQHPTEALEKDTILSLQPPDLYHLSALPSTHLYLETQGRLLFVVVFSIALCACGFVDDVLLLSPGSA